MEWYEVAFARMYPLLYPHRDDEEAERVLVSYGDLIQTRGPVLDLACGNGRYMAAAAGVGVATWGIDLSEFLLAEAVESRSLGGRVIQGDMRRLPFRDAGFGAVLNMFTSFGYFEGDVDNLLVFREVARVLRPGGVLLFDFVNAGWIRNHPHGETKRESQGYTIREKRALKDGGRYIVKRVEATSAEKDDHIAYEERVRLYTPAELTTMLESVGLGVVGVFGDYDRGEFEPRGSERIVMVCEKV